MAVALYIIELLFLLTLLAAYKKGDRALFSYATSPAGSILLGAFLALIVTALGLTYQLQRRPAWRQQFVPTLALTLWSLLLALGGVEVAVRAFARETPSGRLFANTLLLPRSWDQLAARNQAVLQKAEAQQTYLVADPELGWTIGPGRRSADYNLDFQERYLAELRRHAGQTDPVHYQRLKASGSDDSIYVSSTEGLRSARVGATLASRQASHRIALIGNSFTFGLEVRYEETWGNQLEQMLGSGFQVLNFGVDGYGVDQAFLRYRRDVVPWHPEIIILGIINDDLRRSMCVYAFLCFPGSSIPFAKPRFVINADTLVLLNYPTPDPGSVLARPTIADLPFLDHDQSFDPAEWEQHSYFASHFVRYLLSSSRFRRWSVPGPTVTTEAMKQVNGALIERFISTARANGSTPMVVFFPARSDFAPGASEPTITQAVLESKRIPYLNMRPCVSTVPPEERFVVLHYSAASNAAIAECLRTEIARLR